MGAALDLINSLGGLPYSVTRVTSDGGYSTSDVAGGGLYTPGTTAVVTIQGLAQPITDKELALLPEGDRQRQGFVIWTEDELKPGLESGMRRADVVTIGGEKFEVMKVQPWGGSDVPHFRSIVLRQEEQT